MHSRLSENGLKPQLYLQVQGREFPDLRKVRHPREREPPAEAHIDFLQVPEQTVEASQAPVDELPAMVEVQGGCLWKDGRPQSDKLPAGKGFLVWLPVVPWAANIAIGG